jgi:hypothetical protein
MTEAGAPGFGPAGPGPAPGDETAGFDTRPRGPGGVLPSRSSGTYRGLPRRVRQASLPPQLRDAPGAGVPPLAAGPGAGPAADRNPEQARNVVASFRAAYQRELDDDAPQTPPGADARQASAPSDESPAGTPSAGVDAGGTQASGTQASGTQASGTQAGGTQAGGAQAGGAQAGGAQAGGAQAGGTQDVWPAGGKRLAWEGDAVQQGGAWEAGGQAAEAPGSGERQDTTPQQEDM